MSAVNLQTVAPAYKAASVDGVTLVLSVSKGMLSKGLTYNPAQLCQDCLLRHLPAVLGFQDTADPVVIVHALTLLPLAAAGVARALRVAFAFATRDTVHRWIALSIIIATQALVKMVHSAIAQHLVFNACVYLDGMAIPVQIR